MIGTDRVFSLLNIPKDRGDLVCDRVRDCICGTRITYGSKVIHRHERYHQCIPIGVG